MVDPGLVVVDKAPGMTSHDVVARVRRLAGTRKVGHAGTLDPMATGVLVLGVNRATRLLGHLMLTEKAYDATIRLGVATTTDDAEGEVVATAGATHLPEARVRDELTRFVGDIEQVPTAVSAIKVDGKRAYARVRAGEDVALAQLALAPRLVEEHDLHAAGSVTDAGGHHRAPVAQHSLGDGPDTDEHERFVARHEVDEHDGVGALHDRRLLTRHEPLDLQGVAEDERVGIRHDVGGHEFVVEGAQQNGRRRRHEGPLSDLRLLRAGRLHPFGRSAGLQVHDEEPALDARRRARVLRVEEAHEELAW